MNLEMEQIKRRLDTQEEKIDTIKFTIGLNSITLLILVLIALFK